MSFDFIVIPLREDQARLEELLAEDDLPETITEAESELAERAIFRKFTSEGEATAYAEGFNALTDLMEYNHVRSKPGAEVYEIDGERVIFDVKNEQESQALSSGLSDASGWISPGLYDSFSQTDPLLNDFPRVQEILVRLTELKAKQDETSSMKP